MLGAGLTSLPAPGVSPSTRGCHSLPRALGRAKVTAQGARGDRWVSLGVALSCWHTGRAAALPPPSPAGSSCSAPHPAVPLLPPHPPLGYTPVTPPPCHTALCPYSQPFSVVISPVPTFISPPQPPREVLRKPRPSCGSSQRPRVTKPPTHAPSSHRGTGGKPPKRPTNPQQKLECRNSGVNTDGWRYFFP